MKKVLGVILALALVFAMAVPAFAADTDDADGNRLKERFYGMLDKLGLEGTDLYQRFVDFIEAKDFGYSRFILGNMMLVAVILFFLPFALPLRMFGLL